MRKNFVYRLVFALAVTGALLVPVPKPAGAQEPVADSADPADVVRAFVAAFNSGDAESAAALLTDTAIRVRPGATGVCSRLTPCVGRDDVLRSMELQVAAHECQTLLDLTVSGSVVTGRFAARNDTFRGVGIERALYLVMALVDQGQIAALYALPDLADPQTAANVAIAAGTQAPGAPLASPTTGCD